MKDNQPHEEHAEAEKKSSQDRLQPPIPDEPKAANPSSGPNHETERVHAQQIEPETILPQPASLPPNPTKDRLENANQRKSHVAHPSTEKKSYALFDFVLIGFGIAIALAIGLLGAGTEYALARRLSDYQWVGGLVGGFVSACGGMVASVFFLNLLSKFLFNRDTDRWKRNKEYPQTWHALLLLIFAIIEPSALIVVVTLGAIGGGIGYGASMNLGEAWTVIVIALAIPITAGAIALLLIYDFADGGTI